MQGVELKKGKFCLKVEFHWGVTATNRASPFSLLCVIKSLVYLNYNMTKNPIALPGPALQTPLSFVILCPVV